MMKKKRKLKRKRKKHGKKYERNSQGQAEKGRDRLGRGGTDRDSQGQTRIGRDRPRQAGRVRHQLDRMSVPAHATGANSR